MDDIRLEKRTIQERLIIAKTLIETALSDLPTADLSEYSDKLWKAAYERGKAEAHPRTGKWIKKVGEIVDTYVCDQCGRKNGVAKTRYCPNCGAKMEESE